MRHQTPQQRRHIPQIPGDEMRHLAMPLQSCCWNVRLDDERQLSVILPSAHCRPEAATDLNDHSIWNMHWSAREESHDDGRCVLAMLNDPAVA